MSELFEQISLDGYRCRVCGAVDSNDTVAPPSMYDGDDETLRCTACGSAEVTDALSGKPLLIIGSCRRCGGPRRWVHTTRRCDDRAHHTTSTRHLGVT